MADCELYKQDEEEPLRATSATTDETESCASLGQSGESLHIRTGIRAGIDLGKLDLRKLLANPSSDVG